MVFLRFLVYSFLGFWLETAYAALTGGRGESRRCCWLLPLCPVYGLGVLAVLALPGAVRENFFSLALWGGAAATAVEFAVHWVYEAWLGVRFWDYGTQRWNLGGRVCLRFSLAWGALLALTLPGLEAVLTPLLEAVPPQVTFALVLAVTADGVCTVRLLRRTGDIALLRSGLLGRQPVAQPAQEVPVHDVPLVLVEDLVAHAGVELEGDGVDARPAEGVGGPAHPLAVFAHGVLFAGEEQYGHVRIHAPEIAGVGHKPNAPEHLPEKAGGGVPVAQRVGEVRVHIGGGGGDPVSAGAVWGKGAVVRAEGQAGDQGAGVG